MMKITEIREYIFRKATEMMQEYSVENLDDIGCFVVLDCLENQLFEVAEMGVTVDKSINFSTNFMENFVLRGHNQIVDFFKHLQGFQTCFKACLFCFQCFRLISE